MGSCLYLSLRCLLLAAESLPTHLVYSHDPERQFRSVLTWLIDSNCEGADNGLVSEMAAASLLRFAGTSPADPGQGAMSYSCTRHFSCCT